MSNEILMASCQELREALQLAMRKNSYEEVEFWRMELVDRLGALSVAVDVASADGRILRDSDGSTEIRVNQGGDARVSGSGFRPGATVQLFLPLAGANAKEIARVPVAEDGSFDGSAPFATRSTDPPLPIGKTSLQLVSLDDNGDEVVVEMTVNIAQGAPAPEANRIEGTIPTLQPGQSITFDGAN